MALKNSSQGGDEADHKHYNNGILFDEKLEFTII